MATHQLSDLKNQSPARAENPFSQKNSVQVSGNALALSDQGRSIAEVQAAMIAAKQYPRDQIVSMDKILNACTRPTLADSAVYQYSKGGSDISGPSIRLAEAIAQQWGNIYFGFNELSRGIDNDGVSYSEVGAYAWDLESNTRRQLQFRVRLWRDTKKGGYALKDERDVYELIANQAQRRVRACILAVIPGDVTEAAVKQCETTLKSHADTSPEAMQKMIDAFSSFGVTKDQIEKRIQRRIDSILPAQFVGLKKIYASLRDGVSVSSDWFDEVEKTTVSDLKQTKKSNPTEHVHQRGEDLDQERKPEETYEDEQNPEPRKEEQPRRQRTSGFEME